MLANAATTLPTGPEWSYEVKWDGYRALVTKDAVGTRIISRNGKDLTGDYPTIVAASKKIDSSSFTLDGELVALDSEGHPSFQALQHRQAAHAVVYHAFDLLSLRGESVRSVPLEDRRRRLKQLIKGTDILMSESLPGSPKDIEREIRRLGLEGVVAKRRNSPYLPGERSDAWIKVKFSPQQEFVVGGYKPNDANFESMLVGYYENGALHFAGKVRAGLIPPVKAEIFREIVGRPSRKCPFVNLPNSESSTSHWGEGITEDDMTKLKWVKPSLVVQVAFVAWTSDGLLRHANFVRHPSRQERDGRDSRRKVLVVRRIALGVCVLWGVIACPVALAAQDDPAELYRQREDLMNAERVADLWAPAASSDYDAAWQLARISYWIGTHAPRNERRAALERGISASQTAIRLDGDRPEGHFWLAADMGALAENSGLITGLKLVGRIRRELERVIALAPLWQQGSAETALGQWYFKVPRLVGGSRSKARVNLAMCSIFSEQHDGAHVPGAVERR